MEKNIYGLLNEVKTDLTEYEAAELSSQELEQHKQRIMMEVKNMEHRFGRKGNFGQAEGRRKSKVWTKAAGVAAACVIAIGGVAAANPVFAKELFSDVFGKLIQNAQGEKYEKEDTEMFTKLGENATAVQAEVESRQGGEGYCTTVENNGVTLSVSDVYCDGYVLYYTAVLETSDEGLSQADGIVIDDKEGKCSTIALDGIDTEGYSTRAFEKAEDGTFVAVQRLDLMNPTDTEMQSGVFELEGKETIVVDWSMWNLSGYLWDQWDEQGEYVSTGKVDGEWRLRFPVTIDRAGNKVSRRKRTALQSRAEPRPRLGWLWKWICQISARRHTTILIMTRILQSVTLRASRSSGWGSRQTSMRTARLLGRLWCCTMARKICPSRRYQRMKSR